MKRALRPLILRIARVFGIPEIHNRLDNLEIERHQLVITSQALERYFEQRMDDRLIDQAQVLTERFDQQIAILRTLLDEAQQAVVDVAVKHSEGLTSELRSHFENEVKRLMRDVDNIRRTRSTDTPQLTFPPETSISTSGTTQVIDDAMYISLEDHFRGDSSEIFERQKAYIPYVKDVVTSDKPLIDLGCGRGEWLKLLKQFEISASGVDSNFAAIEECKEFGLDAKHGNLIEVLYNLPDSSIGAITMFQVLEHLPFEVIIDVLREVLRVLTPGGVFIGEVPNSETLRVGATTFWIDPTHQKPLFPGVLTFLASTVGFSQIEGRYSSPLAPVPDLSELPPSAASAILELHHAINGPGDFALIATA